MYCCVGGGHENTSDAFQILSVLPDIGVAFDRAGERSALCVRAETLTVQWRHFHWLVLQYKSYFGQRQRLCKLAPAGFETDSRCGSMLQGEIFYMLRIKSMAEFFLNH